MSIRCSGSASSARACRTAANLLPMPTDLAAEALLERCAAALQLQFPQTPAAQLSVIADTPAELVLSAADEYRLHFPRDPQAAERLELQARLLPHLRGFLSPAVPLFELRGERSRDWPHGWYGAKTVAGRPLRAAAINDDNIERLVRGLAQFLYELHQFPLPRARSRGIAPARSWREQVEALARRSSAGLRPLLRFSEHARVRRWWRAYLDDQAAWSYEPTVVHGALGEQQLLLDAMRRDLIGVVGWGAVCAGDPAIDFAAVVEAYGSDFGWRVMIRYGEVGGQADAGLFRRVRQQGVVTRFRELVEAVEAGGGEGAAAAVAALRASAALRG